VTTTNAETAPALTSFFATAAIACFTYALLTIIVLHVLRPDYAPASHMISDYGVGPYGWVMVTWFVATSCGCLMLLLGLSRSGLNSITARLGVLLLGIASIGLLVSAVFPTDLAGGPRTRAGEIHTISFLVNIGSIIVATVLLSLSFGSSPRWRTYRSTAVVLTLLILVAFVIQFRTLHRGMPYGLANRLFVAVLFAWFLATAFRLRTLARG